jgi:hypothetical protein
MNYQGGEIPPVFLCLFFWQPEGKYNQHGQDHYRGARRDIKQSGRVGRNPVNKHNNLYHQEDYAPYDSKRAEKLALEDYRQNRNNREDDYYGDEFAGTKQGYIGSAIAERHRAVNDITYKIQNP